MERIKVARDGKGFAGASSGKKFVPVGFNYDRDFQMRLIEDYWDTEWGTVVEDFREMKSLGANVVRVHLQFAKFMERADAPNERALAQLKRLLALAEETRLYLDVTGLGSYRKAEVPPWYQSLGERDRWAAQARFWEAVARTCAESPSVFCYNLMNEPVVPEEKRDDWLVGQLAGFYYVEAITLDRAGRDRSNVARQWIGRLTAPIQKHDPQRMITVGLLPNSADEPSGSGFVPAAIAPQLDYISVHLYPRSGQLDEQLETLKKFAVGKPVVIEEMFPMHCSAEELLQFVEKSKASASGWLGFYWGQTPEQLSASTNASEAITREWLKVFEQMQAAARR